METEIKKVNEEEIRRLIKDVDLIKEILAINKNDPEGELSDWAKKELKRARETPESEYISHEEVRKKILAK